MTTSGNAVLVTSAQAEAARMIAERDRAQGREPSDTVLKIASAEPAPFTKLLSLLSRLDTTTSEVLRLRVVAGLNIDEVAEALNLNTGQVRRKQHQGLSQLRRWLDEAGVDLNSNSERLGEDDIGSHPFDLAATKDPLQRASRG